MSHTYGNSSSEVLAAPLSSGESNVRVAVAPPASAAKHHVFTQFIKFCVVGLSSTIISLAITFFLLRKMHLADVLHRMLVLHPDTQRFVESNHLYIQVAGTIAFFFGVANGFYWNSKWTFPHGNSVRRRVQCFRFFAVNIVGQVLNWFVTWGLMQMLANGLSPKEVTWQSSASIIGAIFIVSFWNFFLNRLWTFKAPKVHSRQQ